MNGRNKNLIGGIMMFLLKLPFRIAALPLLITLIAIRFASGLITALSSVVTNTLGTAAILAAAGIWMFNLGTNQDAYKMVGFAAFLFIAPHAADWLVGKTTDLGTSLVAFLMG